MQKGTHFWEGYLLYNKNQILEVICIQFFNSLNCFGGLEA